MGKKYSSVVAVHYEMEFFETSTLLCEYVCVCVCVSVSECVSIYIYVRDISNEVSNLTDKINKIILI